MNNKILIFFLILNLIGCNSTPTVTGSWVDTNCKPIEAFTPDKKPKYSYCKSLDGISQTCKRNNEIYKGTFLNGKRHGEGEIIFSKSYHSYKGVFKDNRKWCGVEQLEDGYNLWVNGQSEYQDQTIDWETIVVGALIVGAVVAAAQSSGGGSSSSAKSSGYAWDGFYLRGNFVYRCRSFNGQFAPNEKCAGKIKNDSTWPEN